MLSAAPARSRVEPATRGCDEVWSAAPARSRVEPATRGSDEVLLAVPARSTVEPATKHYLESFTAARITTFVLFCLNVLLSRDHSRLVYPL